MTTQQLMKVSVPLRGEYKRSASYWRMQGFPVYQNIPDNALGYIRGEMHGAEIVFEWWEDKKEEEKS